MAHARRTLAWRLGEGCTATLYCTVLHFLWAASQKRAAHDCFSSPNISFLSLSLSLFASSETDLVYTLICNPASRLQLDTLLQLQQPPPLYLDSLSVRFPTKHASCSRHPCHPLPPSSKPPSHIPTRRARPGPHRPWRDPSAAAPAATPLFFALYSSVPLELKIKGRIEVQRCRRRRRRRSVSRTPFPKTQNRQAQRAIYTPVNAAR